MCDHRRRRTVRQLLRGLSSDVKYGWELRNMQTLREVTASEAAEACLKSVPPGRHCALGPGLCASCARADQAGKCAAIVLATVRAPAVSDPG